MTKCNVVLVSVIRKWGSFSLALGCPWWWWQHWCSHHSLFSWLPVRGLQRRENAMITLSLAPMLCPRTLSLFLSFFLTCSFSITLLLSYRHLSLILSPFLTVFFSCHCTVTVTPSLSPTHPPASVTAYIFHRGKPSLWGVVKTTMFPMVILSAAC